MPARRIAPLAPLALLALVASLGCGGSGGTPAGPLEAVPDVRVSGPAGLEQHLVLTIDPDGYRPEVGHILHLTSRIENRGSSPVKVVARSCLLHDADISTTADLERMDELVSCAAVNETRDLAPGESTSQIRQMFRIDSPAGTYTIRIRHALDPEFRAEASFTVR